MDKIVSIFEMKGGLKKIDLIKFSNEQSIREYLIMKSAEVLLTKRLILGVL